MKYNNIITYTKESKNLSPIPMPYWTYPEEIYNALKEMYPTAFDNKNRTRLLELFIIDRFLIGKLDIQLAHNFVMGLAGRGLQYSGEVIEEARLNLNGLFELHNYTEELKQHMLDTTWTEEDLEMSGWQDLNFTWRKSNAKGGLNISGSRVGLYLPTDAFENQKDNYLNIRYDAQKRLFIITGNSNSKKSVETFRNILRDYAKDLNYYYKKNGTLPGMLKLLELVNELVNNKSSKLLIKKNAPIALEYIENSKDNNEGLCEDFNNNEEKIKMLYAHHKSSIERLIDAPMKIYTLPKPGSPRMFDGLDQALAREVRTMIYPEACGCFDLDLCRSQLAIIGHLSKCPGLIEWLSKDSIWDEVRLDTGIPKWIAKSCLYTYCFGGNSNTWYRENYIEKEYAEELKAHPLYKSLLRAGNSLRREIEADGFIELEKGFRLSLDKDFNSRQALATKVQWIETMIIKEVVNYINDNKDIINLIGLYHDGILIRMRPKTKSIRTHLENINSIAKRKGRDFGIKNISLDYK